MPPQLPRRPLEQTHCDGHIPARSALFRKRSASQDRTSGKVVGYESGGGDRSKGDDWWYDVKLAWDEPWVSISQTELLKLNPRNGGDQF